MASKISRMSLQEAIRQFSDEVATERMFIEARWPNGVACPFCGSLGVKDRPTRKPAPFRCYDCHKDFSVGGPSTAADINTG